ncbi:MAG TPA: hypothetical protein VHY58_15930 [Streptosporangiaceae bacterium]|jgi:hypothetical protein|nr:hypothetical protein [Streptosporangiaceae bacterium]
MSDRTTLTQLYLGEIERAKVTAAELRGKLPESELLNAYFHGRYLSRPVFLGYDERTQLCADLEIVRAALVGLPDRMYGGDVAAFARAVGLNEDQISAVLRSRGPQTSLHAKADLQVGESGFRMLEYNMGSMIGGTDNADICRAMMEHPLLAEFARAHRLGYADTRRETVANVLTEGGFKPDSYPVVAVTVWPHAWDTDLGPFLQLIAEQWRELGLDAHACHLGQLEIRGGRVWLDGRVVDVVYRLFLLEHLLEPGGPAVMDPILDATARGEVAMFTPLDSELYASKAALALLSGEASRDLFTSAERAAFDRIVPWTRIVRPGPATLEDGRVADLMDYAVSHRDDLVLKPAGGCAGEGVVLGWDPATTPELWREQLARATRDTYVLQRRIRSVPELFPDDTGGLVPWHVTWAVFRAISGYGGVFARALAASSGTELINRVSGTSVGCCLSEEPGPEHSGPKNTGKAAPW